MTSPERAPAPPCHRRRRPRSDDARTPSVSLMSEPRRWTDVRRRRSSARSLSVSGRGSGCPTAWASQTNSRTVCGRGCSKRCATVIAGGVTQGPRVPSSRWRVPAHPAWSGKSRPPAHRASISARRRPTSPTAHIPSGVRAEGTPHGATSRAHRATPIRARTPCPSAPQAGRAAARICLLSQVRKSSSDHRSRTSAPQVPG
jgi:hypothetical protein